MASSLTITPVEPGPEQKFNFGAFITGLDLNSISEKEARDLQSAIWRHKVVIIKDQAQLDPKKQWELVKMLDPNAKDGHSHGDIKTFRAKGGLLAQGREVVGIPGAENVRLIGKGFQGEDHYGIKNHTVVRGLSLDFHATPPSDEEFQQGITRFQRWHIDAPLYARDPAWFTSLRCIKLPHGDDLTIEWADGSGLSMKTVPGRTAFFSCSQLYNMLSAEEKLLVDNSWVEYAPYPYQWIQNCKGNSNGLGLAAGGQRMALEELGDWDSASVKKYPLVWVNPQTGEKAFQVHSICARRLFLRSGPDEETRIVDEPEEIQAFIQNIQKRILRPEYIFLAPIEEGDMVIWDNYSMFHSAVDYPVKLGSRTMHQANISGSIGPMGPVPNSISVDA